MPTRKIIERVIQEVNQDEAARDALKREIKARRAYLDMTQYELADALGISSPVMSDLLSNPDKISAGRLRRIIRRLNLDPIVVLKFLGYSQKEIEKFLRVASAQK
jgi:transcriptional regulator with XRE-family HTH domain